MVALKVANILKVNKDEVGKHVLFLGTDMPLKPRNETLSTLLGEAMEALCLEEIPGFSELPEEEKTAASHVLLSRLSLTDRARQRVAGIVLKDLEISEGWIWLAQLTKAGYFSLIFTFSPHDLLERGLALEKMAPGEDYNLVVAGLDDREIVGGAVQKSARITVVKLGGDLKRGFVPLTPEEVARNVRLAGGIIHSVSSRALVMVAHSPAEEGIMRYLSRSGGPVFWISPKAPVEERGRFDEMKIGDPEGVRAHAFSPEAAVFLSQRGSRDNLLTREKGEFDSFFAAMQYRLLRRGLDTHISYIKRKTLISAPDTPFKFLQPFDQKDATIFYGREQESRDLADLVTTARLSVILGRSGVGKTSLIRAGVAPILEEREWLSIVLRPVGDTVARIKGQVLDWTEPEQGGALDSLEGAPLATFLESALRTLEGRLVIFLDQFEEIFTKLPEETRTELVATLASCLNEPELPVNVVFSLREDHFADLCDLQPTLRGIFENVYRLKKMSRGAAVLAMTKPAEKFRLTVEPSLVERVLNDLDAEGIDPSGLELVMYAAHSALPLGEQMLSSRLYHSTGGTEGLLKDCVEGALKHLTWRERPLTRRVLKELVLGSGQRALVSDAKIAQDLGVKPETASTILWELEDAGLVRRVEEESKAAEYELVHDFLATYISQWLNEKEARARETQAMIQRELRGFRSRGTLLAPAKVNLLYEQRTNLTLDDEELRFIVASSFEVNQDISPWTEKVSRLDETWERLLRRILRRGNESQRSAALRLVERVGERDFIQSLLASLPTSLGLQRAALSALLSRGGRTLASDVTSGATEERKRAISTLAHIGSHKAGPSLIKALQDPDEEVRQSASQAIEEIGGEKMADMLVHRLLSSSDSARWEIADTLVKLTGRLSSVPIIKALGGAGIVEGYRTTDDGSGLSAIRRLPDTSDNPARDYVLGRILTRRRQVAAAREVLIRGQRAAQSSPESSFFTTALAELDEVETHLASGFYAWKMFRKDSSHSGQTQESIVPPLSVAWSLKTEDQVVSSPAVDRATVFCPSRNGQVYALEINSGVPLWQQKVTSHIDSSPALEGDSLFLGTTDGQLISLEAPTGKVRWRFSAGGEVRSSPTVHQAIVFFGCWDGSLYAVNAETGEQAWRTETGGEIYSSPAIANGHVVVANWVGEVLALDREKGEVIWRFPTSEEVYSSPTIQDEFVFVGSDDGYLYCLRLSDGSPVWRTHLGGRIRSSPAVGKGKVVVGSSDGNLYCLSSQTGERLWLNQTKDEISSSPAIAGDLVFFCSRYGTVAAAHLESGELLWKHSTAFGISSSPAIAEGKVIVGINYSEICAFQTEAQP